jgi:hypothetical protein
VLGRKHQVGADIEHLVARFGELHRNAVFRALGLAVDRLAQPLVEKVLRVEAQPLRSALLPGCGAQVAHRHLALAGVELRNLAELQRVSFAGAAGEIVEDAPAHRLHRALAAGVGELEIVDRPVRGESDRCGLGHARGRALRPGGRRGHCQQASHAGGCQYGKDRTCGHFHSRISCSCLCPAT